MLNFFNLFIYELNNFSFFAKLAKQHKLNILTMKTLFTLSFAIFFWLNTSAQTLSKFVDLTNIQVGDELVIGKFSGHQDFRFIDFGKPNFIIKKGGLYQPRYLSGMKVKLVHIKEKNNKKVWVIKPANDIRFMQVVSSAYISDLQNAIESGEIIVI